MTSRTLFHGAVRFLGDKNPMARRARRSPKRLAISACLAVPVFAGLFLGQAECAPRFSVVRPNRAPGMRLEDRIGLGAPPAPGGEAFERPRFEPDDEFERPWRSEDEELVLEAEEALRAIYASEGPDFQFAERILAGMGNARGLIRLLDENMAGAIVMLSHIEDLSGHRDLLDWVLDAAKRGEGLRRKSLDRLAALARGVGEWTALPAEQRDGLSMDRLEAMNSRLEEGNLRIQGLVAGLKAFSEQVNDLRLAEGPITADGLLEEAVKVREVRERLIRELAERRDAMYFDLRASDVLEKRK